MREGLVWVAVQTLFIVPGYPCENRYVESFFGKLRNGLLDREIFYALTAGRGLIERWRMHYNMIGLRSALDYKPP
jgi:hypothetical protein